MRHVLQDLRANNGEAAPGARPQLSLSTVLTARFVSVLLFRLSQTLGRRSPLAASAVKQFNQFLTGADLAWQARIGPGLVLRHPIGVVVGIGVEAGRNLTLQQGVTLGGDGTETPDPSNFPRVGDNVHVGAGARLIGGVVVGDRVTVGANAVVISDVPDDCVAVGVPARVVGAGRSS